MTYKPWLKPLVPEWAVSTALCVFGLAFVGGFVYLVVRGMQAGEDCRRRGGVMIYGECAKRLDP